MKIVYQKQGGLQYEYYYTRLKVYKASNLEFNPLTGFSTSYDWYHLSKRINNTLVLNTYNYSTSTIKHVSKVRRVMGLLSMEYVSIESPRGLQDLTGALNHIIEKYAQETVRFKYSRKKYDGSMIYYSQMLNEVEKLLGVRTKQKVINQAIKDAEEIRIEYLRIQKEKRQIKHDMSVSK